MAVRTPLKLDGSDLKQMSAAEITAIKNQAIYLYGQNPSVSLSQVSTGGNLGSIDDTRKDVGAVSTSNTAFIGSATTEDAITVTVGFARISQTVTSITESVDTSNKAFPVYLDGDNNIQAMSLQDVYDTFVPAATTATLANGSAHPGVYRISTATSIASHDLVSSTPVFVDTIADLSLYETAPADLIEAQGQTPITQNNYYLHKGTGSAVSYPNPVFITSSNDLQEFTSASFDSILENCIRHRLSGGATNSKLRYSIDGAGGQVSGTVMENKQYDGSTYYTEQEADNYYSQEFPSGTAQVVNSYSLKVHIE